MPPAAVAVVGGVYEEIVRDAGIRRLAGSGMRGAAVLAGWGGSVRLHARVDAGSVEQAHAVAAGGGVDLVVAARPGPVGFDYETALAQPRTHGAWPVGDEPLSVAADLVVGYGMVEGGWTARADTLVVDAQHSALADCGAGATTSRRSALVVNDREIRRLAGHVSGQDLPVAARAVAAEAGFDVVVVKCGARGALVVQGRAVDWVPAVRTRAVAAVGTGDVFTAGFAHAWGVLGQDPAAAARTAGAATAWHAAGAGLHVPDEALAGVLPDGAEPGEWGPEARGAVYLAGPFFTLAQKWQVDVARRGLLDIGADVFSPWHDVGDGGDEVADADLAGLAGAGAVLALLDGADAGTLFECGWATRAGIAVIGVAADPGVHDWVMLRGTGAGVVGDLATAAYLSCWAALAASNGRSGA